MFYKASTCPNKQFVYLVPIHTLQLSRITLNKFNGKRIRSIESNKLLTVTVKAVSFEHICRGDYREGTGERRQLSRPRGLTMIFVYTLTTWLKVRSANYAQNCMGNHTCSPA